MTDETVPMTDAERATNDKRVAQAAKSFFLLAKAAKILNDAIDSGAELTYRINWAEPPHGYDISISIRHPEGMSTFRAAKAAEPGAAADPAT